MKINHANHTNPKCPVYTYPVQNIRVLGDDALYGPRGVHFVYISLDKNPAAWERAVQTVGLTNAASYLSVHNYYSPIARQLSLSSIPRYVLVG